MGLMSVCAEPSENRRERVDALHRDFRGESSGVGLRSKWKGRCSVRALASVGSLEAQARPKAVQVGMHWRRHCPPPMALRVR